MAYRSVASVLRCFAVAPSSITPLSSGRAMPAAAVRRERIAFGRQSAPSSSLARALVPEEVHEGLGAVANMEVPCRFGCSLRRRIRRTISSPIITASNAALEASMSYPFAVRLLRNGPRSGGFVLIDTRLG